MLKKLSQSVTTQLRITLGILSLFSLFSLFSIYRQIDSTTNDARVINYAGIVRGKTQRLIKLAFTETVSDVDGESSDQASDEFSDRETPLFEDEFSLEAAPLEPFTDSPTPESQEKIDTMIADLDEILTSLTNGSQALNLIKLNDPAFQTNTQQLSQAWADLKEFLANYRANPTAQNYELLLTASETYWDLTNQTVFSAEAYAKRHIGQSKQVALALLIINLMLLTSIFYVSQRIRNKLKSSSSHLTTSSSEISVTVTQQKQIAHQQAASVNHTTTTMDELETSSQHSADQAHSAMLFAKTALARTQEGNLALSDTLKGMSALEQTVGAIAEKIIYLSSQADQIGEISELVADFANQTNMLALNSSVEAVRAGEHGKGFSIVANEIRKLSDQSQESAAKINLLVEDIQKAITSTVMVTEEGTKTVKSGVKQVQSAEYAFQGIKESMDTVVLNNQQVSITLKQQVEAIHQVVEAMTVIQNGSEENVEGLTQTQVRANHLTQTAAVLQKMV
ncbi:MAG: methyl-accepting chemotaxis protein [Cyanobacteria bacterium P01_A01_bin.114]